MTDEELRCGLAEEEDEEQWLVDGRYSSGGRDRGFYTIAWLSTDEMLSDVPPTGLADVLQDYKQAVTTELDNAIARCKPKKAARPKK